MISLIFFFVFFHRSLSFLKPANLNSLSARLQNSMPLSSVNGEFLFADDVSLIVF